MTESPTKTPIRGPGVHVERPHNETATWSVVVGVAGVILGSFVFFFWVALPAGVVAIVMARNAIRQANAHPAMGRKWVAWIGIVAGLIAIAFAIHDIAAIVQAD
jgi:ABC-type nickel/cobalt efflux system permease component RcnA